MFDLVLIRQSGADRYDIHLHNQRPSTVRDLMQELEKKSRVTTGNQQLIFRGQRLHQTPDQELAKFGLFNGNHITLIGNRVSDIPLRSATDRICLFS
jgi:hypothetical protein